MVDARQNGVSHLMATDRGVVRNSPQDRSAWERVLLTHLTPLALLAWRFTVMPLFPLLYDFVMARAERGRLGDWRARVVTAARGRVLEIAAGTGLNFSHYDPSALVIGIDPDVSMLARAKGRAFHARAAILLVVADAEALPFRDAAFDEGVGGLAMCTIPHPEGALAELLRTLVTGGQLRLLEHVRSPSFLVGRMQDLLTPFWRRAAGGCRLNRRTVEAVAKSSFVIDSTTSHAAGNVQESVARSP